MLPAAGDGPHAPDDLSRILWVRAGSDSSSSLCALRVLVSTWDNAAQFLEYDPQSFVYVLAAAVVAFGLSRKSAAERLLVVPTGLVAVLGLSLDGFYVWAQMLAVPDAMVLVVVLIIDVLETGSTPGLFRQ